MDVDLSLIPAQKSESAETTLCTQHKSLNIVSEDAYGCCGAIRKALQKDASIDTWTCPKCGMDWKPRMVDGMRLWEARPAFMKWR